MEQVLDEEHSTGSSSNQQSRTAPVQQSQTTPAQQSRTTPAQQSQTAPAQQSQTAAARQSQPVPAMVPSLNINSQMGPVVYCPTQGPSPQGVSFAIKTYSNFR